MIADSVKKRFFDEQAKIQVKKAVEITESRTKIDSGKICLEKLKE
jgi:hypothetical protein